MHLHYALDVGQFAIGAQGRALRPSSPAIPAPVILSKLRLRVGRSIVATILDTKASAQRPVDQWVCVV
jgi:hypothetical protein